MLFSIIISPVFATEITDPATCDSGTLSTDTGPTNLRANYESNTLNLKWYDENNTQLTTNTCTYGGAINMPTAPTKRGYTFKGWKVVPYTPMEYFENQRDKYINTGIIPNQDNVVMEIKVRPTSGSWYIWQNRDSVNGIYGITGSRNNNTIGIRCANDDRQITSTITRNETHIYIIRATYNNGNATLYVKDLTANQEAVNTGTYTYVQQTLPLWMFGNQQGNYIQGDNRVYYAKMWVGGDLVMDYEPGIQDGVAGFYDNVTKTFKTPLDGN